MGRASIPSKSLQGREKLGLIRCSGIPQFARFHSTIHLCNIQGPLNRKSLHIVDVLTQHGIGRFHLYDRRSVRQDVVQQKYLRCCDTWGLECSLNLVERELGSLALAGCSDIVIDYSEELRMYRLGRLPSEVLAYYVKGTERTH